MVETGVETERARNASQLIISEYESETSDEGEGKRYLGEDIHVADLLTAIKITDGGSTNGADGISKNDFTFLLEVKLKEHYEKYMNLIKLCENIYD